MQNQACEAKAGRDAIEDKEEMEEITVQKLPKKRVAFDLE